MFNTKHKCYNKELEDERKKKQDGDIGASGNLRAKHILRGGLQLPVVPAMLTVALCYQDQIISMVQKVKPLDYTHLYDGVLGPH